MSHLSFPQETEGNKREIQSSDDDVLGVLNQILKEIKIINIQLAEIAGEEIKHEDVE